MTRYTLPTLDPEAAAFFAEHAGASWNPAIETPEEGTQRNARILARAEAWRKADTDLRIDWTDDWEVSDHVAAYDGYDHEPETCECAVLTNGNVDVLASLCCIDDATPEYRRVVEAELALEAMPSELVCGCETPDLAECGSCGSTWCDKCNPAPSARCHFEYDHDEAPRFTVIAVRIRGEVDSSDLDELREQISQTVAEFVDDFDMEVHL